MQHLSPERIAALVDEPATHDERTHFEACARCRADFVAVRRIVAAASAERDRPITPLVPWQQLSNALRDEGLLQAAGANVAQVRHPPVESSDVRSISSAPSLQPSVSRDGLVRQRNPFMRVAGLAAAAAALLTAGVVGGRMMGAGSTGIMPEMAAVQTASPSIP
ncbi:MAG TPA: hypothetical protein VE861_04215, partial [Gemmatimonadaceae bacterium]|nr:hypothetical protein [Gemmatimonadaceae bacterium]